MLNKKTLSIILLLMLPTLVVAAGAQPKYKIEALVFKSLTSSESNEIWSTQADGEEKSSPKNRSDQQIQPKIVNTQTTSNETSGLHKIRKRLEESGDYIVLDYRRWQQLADARSQSPVTRYDSSHEDIGQLEGDIQFYMSRFLHINIDLNLIPQHFDAIETESGQTAQPVYQIRQGKRVKSGNVYYFDHPEFGVLLYIKPVKS